MAEKHIQYGLDGALTNSLMHKLYTFIASGQSGILEFVADTGFSSVPSVSLNGSAYGTPSVYTDWGDGSYFVFRPTAAMSGSDRWHCKVTRVNTTNISIQVDFKGTWVSKAFTASACKTASVQWTNTNPPSNALVYCSTGTETYDTTRSYTYCRMMVYSPSNVENDRFNQGFYVGGYIPAKPASDLNPACMLARIPHGQLDYGSSWGDGASTSMCRTPVEYAHTTLDLTTSGRCHVAHLNAAAARINSSTVLQQAHTCEGGDYVDFPLYLIRDSTVVGVFGPNTMRGACLDRVDGSADTAAEFVVVDDLMMRWKPSA